eukprot:scaffold55487_cov19-Tisochrysis_lutea.AAC.4
MVLTSWGGCSACGGGGGGSAAQHMVELMAQLQVLYLVLDHDLLEATGAAVSFAISESVSAQSALGA